MDLHCELLTFVCPTAQARSLFDPDYIIWVDTIEKGRFEDTNKIFLYLLKSMTLEVTEQNSELWAFKIADKTLPYKWDNKNQQLKC